MFEEPKPAGHYSKFYINKFYINKFYIVSRFVPYSIVVLYPINSRFVPYYIPKTIYRLVHYLLDADSLFLLCIFFLKEKISSQF